VAYTRAPLRYNASEFASRALAKEKKHAVLNVRQSEFEHAMLDKAILYESITDSLSP